MERFRSRRSKIAGNVDDRSSVDGSFPSDQRHSCRGNGKVLNLRKFSKLASDSSSCSSGVTDEDSFTFELGLRSSKLAVGTPMKKLLAKEMSKETESKRRSPSVVAKLMGLDGLPPQQPAHKQKNSISENNPPSTRSIENGPRSSMRYEHHRSSRKSSKEEQEFKDVYEVLETSKVGSCSYPSQVTANSKLTDAERAFIQQKFMDAKRLSTDEKLQDSKEFHDALEVLDSNKDLLLKFLQQPDSLFTKHLHDLQGGPPQPLCARVAAMKSSETQMLEKTHLGGKSTKETRRKSRNPSPPKHRDRRSSRSDHCHVAESSLNSAKYPLERADESSIPPTRIVVLKPNLGKVLIATDTVSSPCSSHGSLSECRKHTEFPCTTKKEMELPGRGNFHSAGNFHSDIGISGNRSRESRELAKEITRQMRNSFNNGSKKISSLSFKGYAGDESSSSISGNESGTESEATSVTSKDAFERKNHSRSLSSRSTESSVSREAKKRLSERWKMSHKSQDVEMICRGSTLAEMLAIPDKEMIPIHSNRVMDELGFRNKFAIDNGPLGISSRDGWKDGCIGTLTRSRSLPASSTAFGSPRALMQREPIRDDRYVIPKEASKRERNKAVNSFDEIVSRNSRNSYKKSSPSRSTVRESNNTSPRIRQKQMKIKVEADKPSEQKIAETESLTGDVHMERESATVSSLDKLLPQLADSKSPPDECHAHERDGLIPQESPIEPPEEASLPLHNSVPGIESPSSSKEAEQPSPVSVLEVPFTDDVSSCSDCFESLSADLQGLRMQLQLLKLESESYEEGPMLVSSDEDFGGGSTRLLDASGLSRAQGSRESCYVINVLINSGLNDTDPDTFAANWNTPECPVNPSVFEELEKKYLEHTSWPKSERRLLFDRINLGILEMFKQFNDPHPWVRSSEKKTFSLRWSRDALQDGVLRFLARQEKSRRKEAADEVLEREAKWLDMGDNIDGIGREVEGLLLEELIQELTSGYVEV
ncbi:hypothetical protein UlMin_005972 [Ulmus minor]